MKLEEKVIRDVINILDNLVYWDTCPKEYKEEIPDLIKALNMHIVGVSLPNEDKMTSEMITECNRWYDKKNTRSNTHFKRGWKLCYRWLKNELK